MKRLRNAGETHLGQLGSGKGMGPTVGFNKVVKRGDKVPNPSRNILDEASGQEEFGGVTLPIKGTKAATLITPKLFGPGQTS
jgi:hypothetical protein